MKQLFDWHHIHWPLADQNCKVFHSAHYWTASHIKQQRPQISSFIVLSLYHSNNGIYRESFSHRKAFVHTKGGDECVQGARRRAYSKWELRNVRQPGLEVGAFGNLFRPLCWHSMPCKLNLCGITVRARQWCCFTQNNLERGINCARVWERDCDCERLINVYCYTGRNLEPLMAPDISVKMHLKQLKKRQWFVYRRFFGWYRYITV